jgi:uncharacterized membrane protein YfcA
MAGTKPGHDEIRRPCPMLSPQFDLPTLAIALLGASLAGFTSGFAGFGTALVASGIWLYVLPAAMVPPLAVLLSVTGQLVSITTIRHAFDWRQTLPYLAGAVVGVPLGVAALEAASPLTIKISVGSFLIAYSFYQLIQRKSFAIGQWGGKIADGIIGFGGGVLGGFAGLSGPLPLIWLQLRGGPSDKQRATYQPFNLVVLAMAAVGMAIGGEVSWHVLTLALICFPATFTAALIGARAYSKVSAKTFQRVVLLMLLMSGCVLIASTVSR